MTTTIALYSLAIAGAALLPQWHDYQHAVGTLPTPAGAVVIAVVFAALGRQAPGATGRASRRAVWASRP